MIVRFPAFSSIVHLSPRDPSWKRQNFERPVIALLETTLAPLCRALTSSAEACMCIVMALILLFTRHQQPLEKNVATFHTVLPSSDTAKNGGRSIRARWGIASSVSGLSDTKAFGLWKVIRYFASSC
ncbi:hypothetical protein QLX08_008417 [Tetragonisca angustula]|uniref:Uncharacterized protein n=1 Tax=Tetragonisca angustula TaxID=166442 RepID=A0AAW0ZKC0_9HYME